MSGTKGARSTERIALAMKAPRVGPAQLASWSTIVAHSTCLACLAARGLERGVREPDAGDRGGSGSAARYVLTRDISPRHALRWLVQTPGIRGLAIGLAMMGEVEENRTRSCSGL